MQPVRGGKRNRAARPPVPWMMAPQDRAPTHSRWHPRPAASSGFSAGRPPGAAPARPARTPPAPATPRRGTGAEPPQPPPPATAPPDPGCPARARPPQPASRVWSRNSVCSTNQSARLAITPTTAAVTADSAPVRVWLPSSRSTKGAPRNTQAKHGTNVAHNVTPAAATAIHGPPALCPARNPTNCSTRISGPGVVSARPSPSSICPGVSQPCVSTAACAA